MKYYSLEEIATILNVSVRIVRGLVKSGELMAKKIGPGWRVSESDLKSYTSGEAPVVEEKAEGTEPSPVEEAKVALELDKVALERAVVASALKDITELPGWLKKVDELKATNEEDRAKIEVDKQTQALTGKAQEERQAEQESQEKYLKKVFATIDKAVAEGEERVEKALEEEAEALAKAEGIVKDAEGLVKRNEFLELVIVAWQSHYHTLRKAIGLTLPEGKTILDYGINKWCWDKIRQGWKDRFFPKLGRGKPVDQVLELEDIAHDADFSDDFYRLVRETGIAEEVAKDIVRNQGDVEVPSDLQYSADAWKLARAVNLSDERVLALLGRVPEAEEMKE